MWSHQAAQQRSLPSWNGEKQLADDSFPCFGVPNLHVLTRVSPRVPMDPATCCSSGMAIDNELSLSIETPALFCWYSRQEHTSSGSSNSPSTGSPSPSSSSASASISSSLFMTDAEEATGDDGDIFRDFWLSQASFLSGQKRRSVDTRHEQQQFLFSTATTDGVNKRVRPTPTSAV